MPFIENGFAFQDFKLLQDISDGIDFICSPKMKCSASIGGEGPFWFVAQKHVLLKAALYVESVYLGHVHIAVHSLIKSIISKEDPR